MSATGATLAIEGLCGLTTIIRAAIVTVYVRGPNVLWTPLSLAASFIPGAPSAIGRASLANHHPAVALARGYANATRERLASSGRGEGAAS